ncbi:MAG: hypothetical protein ACKVZ0_23255 [Gemmatimonadales bacterium]
MSNDISNSNADDAALQAVRGELVKDGSARWKRVLEKFLMAAIGSIPWVGGFLAAAASIPGDESAVRQDSLQTKWLDEHERKLEQLRGTLDEVSGRFEKLGHDIEERVQSPEYLALVRQAFRTWDRSETDDKRRYVANLLSNAAGTRICSDDVLRLFITWLDLYHEAHFAVIREVFKNPGSTRFDVWTELYGELPREDSAEADLYKLLIRDLSTGGVLRQARDTNESGQFLRKRVARRRGAAPTTMESAFEDSKPYLLTELGKQFVHYTMNEVVARLAPTGA